MKDPKSHQNYQKLNADLSDYEDDDHVLPVTGGLYLVTSPTIPYSFTLRKVTNAAQSTKSNYVGKLQKFKDMGVQVTDLVYENNVVNSGVHCHGTMQVPKKFNMKKFRTRGWHIKLDEIYDYAGWLSYMTKQNILEQNYSVSQASEALPVPQGFTDSDLDQEDTEPQIKLPKCKLF